MNTDSYWDESGLLKARKHERDGNMLLRTAYYHLFGGKALSVPKVERAISIMESHGSWAQHPYTTHGQDRASHDEMTAIFYFSSLSKGPVQSYLRLYIDGTNVWKYLHQPQVFFFLLACKYKWSWAIEAAYFPNAALNFTEEEGCKRQMGH